MWLTLLFFPIVAMMWGQAAEPAPAAHENLNAVNWVQTAAEYRASALQTYRGAERALLRALSNTTWTAALEQSRPAPGLPPAVILDLDETVLDNSAYQARMTAAATQFSDSTWRQWVAEKRAGLVPGARDFLLLAHSHGVAPVYITNRVCEPNKPDDPTVAVLRVHHLPFSPERLLCKTGTSDKADRRYRAAAGYRILLLIGDDLNDFISIPQESNIVEARMLAADTYGRFWGERWFLLPNPAYGSWERAVGSGIGAKRKALRQ